MAPLNQTFQKLRSSGKEAHSNLTVSDEIARIHLRHGLQLRLIYRRPYRTQRLRQTKTNNVLHRRIRDLWQANLTSRLLHTVDNALGGIDQRTVPVKNNQFKAQTHTPPSSKYC